MSSIFKMVKRPIGVEDIQFDTEGTGATTTFQDATGTSHTSTKLNASHIPVKVIVGSTFTNVQEGVENLLGRVQHLEEVEDYLAADMTVTIANTVTGQSVIDDIPKNLNGHTVTVKFSRNASYLGQEYRFANFSSGVMVIQLNGATISPNQSYAYSSLWFKDCDAKIIINGQSSISRKAVISTPNSYDPTLTSAPPCAIYINNSFVEINSVVFSCLNYTVGQDMLGVLLVDGGDCLMSATIDWQEYEEMYWTKVTNYGGITERDKIIMSNMTSSFAQLDDNGKILESQLPENSVTIISGTISDIEISPDRIYKWQPLGNTNSISLSSQWDNGQGHLMQFSVLDILKASTVSIDFNGMLLHGELNDGRHNMCIVRNFDGVVDCFVTDSNRSI